MAFSKNHFDKEAEEVIEDLRDQLENYRRQIREIEHSHNLEVSAIHASHELVVKEFEFKLAHNDSKQVVELKNENAGLKTKVAVLEARNKELDKLVDFNADIIDVKELTKQLINKLPEINLKSITVQNNGKSA